MKRKQLRFGNGFKVIFGNVRSQAAQMVIAPGEAEGGPNNRHRGADQLSCRARVLPIEGTPLPIPINRMGDASQRPSR